MPPRVLLVCFGLSAAHCADPSGSPPPGDARSGDRTSGGGDDAAGDALNPDDGGPMGPDNRPPGDAGGLSTLIITEVVDGTLMGGVPKFVELTNVGATTADLSRYSLGVFVNGNTTLRSPDISTPLDSRSVALRGSLGPCQHYVVNFENADGNPGSSTFFSVFGFDPDHTDFDAVFNGDDAIVLFEGLATASGTDATTVDSFGQVGIDGSNQSWEYVDGRAARNGTPAATTPATPTGDPSSFGFDDTHWTYTGRDAFDGFTAPQIAAASDPGEHISSACP